MYKFQFIKRLSNTDKYKIKLRRSIVLRSFCGLFEILDGGLEHLDVVFTQHILIQAIADTLAVTHLVDDPAVGGGDALDGVQGTVGIEVDIAGGLVLQIHILGSDLAIGSQLADNGQIATQYVDLNGKPTMDTEFNPNGSLFAIEGIISPDGRVLGKMGHSERWQQGIYRNVPGEYDMKLFKSAVKYFK